MKRYRLVTVQNGREHVSTVVSGAAEVNADLLAEAKIHRMAGWKVTVGSGRVVAEKGDIFRVIFFREFDPMEDYESPEAT